MLLIKYVDVMMDTLPKIIFVLRSTAANKINIMIKFNQDAHASQDSEESMEFAQVVLEDLHLIPKPKNVEDVVPMKSFLEMPASVPMGMEGIRVHA